MNTVLQFPSTASPSSARSTMSTQSTATNPPSATQNLPSAIRHPQSPTLPVCVHPDTIAYLIQDLGCDLPPDTRLTPAELIPYVEDRLNEVDDYLGAQVQTQTLTPNFQNLVKHCKIQGGLIHLLNLLDAAVEDEKGSQNQTPISLQPTGDHPLKGGRLPAETAAPFQPISTASNSKSTIQNPHSAAPNPQSEIRDPQSSIPPTLLAACQRLGVDLPAHPAPTPKTLLPLIEHRVLEHASHPALECENPDSAAYLEAKEIHQALLQLLADLQTFATAPTTPKTNQPPSAQPTGDHPLKPGRLPAQNAAPSEPESGGAPSTPAAPANPPTETQDPPSPNAAHPQSEPQNPPSPPSSTDSTTPPVALPPLTPPQQQILAALQNPPRPLSPLDQLSSERQAALYELLLANPYPDVLAIVQLPAPHGWGLHTSQSALSRFVQRYPIKQHRDETEAFAAANDRLPDHPELTEAQILAETDRLLNLRILRLSRSRTASTRDLRDLFQIKHRQRQLALAERRLESQFPPPNSKS